jgi:cardiolipin synthase
VLKGKKSKWCHLNRWPSRIALTFIGSFFLIFYATYVPLPNEKHPICFYTTHRKDDLRRVTLKALKRASRTVHIHTYALTDPQILSLLMKKAREGVSVNITYHQKNTPKLGSLPLFHLHPEKRSGLMHAKWMVIDETFTLLGTANLTSSSLVMHENLQMGIFSSTFAKALISPSSFQEKIAEQTLSFFLLPSSIAEEALINQLSQAKYTVDIALFTFTHPRIVDLLISLKQQGVAISITLDQSSARGASKKAFDRCVKGGIPINLSQGLPLFHHKWALIDDSTLILGSANWTQAAFKKNKDFILFLSPLIKT